MGDAHSFDHGESALEVSLSDLSSSVEIDSETYRKATENYREFSLTNLSVNKTLPVDLFIPMLNRSKNQVVMYKVFAKGKPLLSKDKSYLLNMGISRFYLHNNQFSDYIAYKNQQAHKLINRPGLSPLVKSKLLYENANLIINQAMGDPRLGDNIELGINYIKDLTEFITSSPDNVQSISEILEVDYSLYTHSVNVCLLLTSFCHFLGMDKSQIIPISLGGLYHDIGKRDIPDAILLKEGKLDDTEWQEMKKHPSYGYDLLRTCNQLNHTVFRMVHQHHENLDGSGYPKKLRGNEISIPGQLIRIIDVYDALTSERVYKKAMQPFTAISIILKEMGQQVSIKYLKLFMTFMGWLVSGPLAQAKLERSRT